MTPSYLFSSEALVTLARYISTDTLFAFDLDGTLAPIVEDYRAAQIAEPVRATLQRLAKHAHVAVITGRSRSDALNILGFEPQLLVGNHGAEWPALPERMNRQQTRQCLLWKEKLFELIGGEPGVDIEFKGESISLHYRKSPDPEHALSRIEEAIGCLSPKPRRVGGKYVVNLMPMEAFTKGESLVEALHRLGLQRAIYFGDDVTDEDVFQLRSIDLFGIHIGSDEGTSAPYFLAKQTELLGLLNSIVGILEFHPDNQDSSNEIKDAYGHRRR